MKELFYRLAGVTIRVIGPDALLNCNDGSLGQYAVHANQWDHTLEFSVVNQLSAPEGELIFSEDTMQIYCDGDVQIRYQGTVSSSFEDGFIRIERHGNHSCIQIRERFLYGHIPAKLVLNSMEAEHIIVENHGVLLHASYIRWKDKAILFTAPSGTGKSTQADLWCRLRGAELINGDRTAVTVDEKGICAAGIPFSGSSGVCKNVTLPVAAIVYLSQAPVTSIEQIAGVRAFRHIWEGCSVNTWNREDLVTCAETVTNIISSIPIYHLACTPDESAVIALENCIE